MSKLPVIEVQIPPGIVTETTERGSRGAYRDCDHIRWRYGMPQKLGGWVLAPLNEEDNASYLGVARAVHDWMDLSGQHWMAIGTHSKLYVINNGRLFDITPIRISGSLVNPFQTENGVSEVQVTHALHGAQQWDRVRFNGASEVGGLTIDGEYEVIEIVSENQYVIDAGTNASSTASGGGAVGYEYDISVGGQHNEEVVGWGTGPFGAGPYGIGAEGIGIERRLRIWSLDNFGENLLASPNGSSLYLWNRSDGPSARATLVEQAPRTIERMLVSPQARHVVAFGGGLGTAIDPGNPDPLFIRWADQENLNVWQSLDENRAGDQRLDKGSEIITAIESRGDILIFTDQSAHALQYVGGQLVFALRHLGQSVSIIGANAAVDVNGVVYAMAEEDFLIYDGVLRVMPCPVRNRVFDDMNRAQGDKAFACVNKRFNEVWWFYPSLESSENDRYVKYNYVEQVWDFGTLPRTAFHDSSPLFRTPYGLYGGKIYQHDVGVDAQDEEGETIPLPSFLQTGYFEIDQAGEMSMHLRAMVPDFKTLVGEVQLTHFGKRMPHDQVAIQKGPYPVDETVARVPLRMNARQVAFEIRTSQIEDYWRMGTWKAEARPKHKRTPRRARVPVVLGGFMASTSGESARTFDGVTWEPINNPTNPPQQFQVFAYSPALGRVLAFSPNVGTRTSYVSDDGGMTWTAGETMTGAPYDAIWSVAHQRFVALFNVSPGIPFIYTSPDGLEWTIQTHPTSPETPTYVRSLCEMSNGRIVFSRERGSRRFLFSDDGAETFSFCDTIFSESESLITSVQWASHLSTLVGQTGQVLFSSADGGENWTSIANQPAGDKGRIAYGSGINRVVVSIFDTGEIQTYLWATEDLVNWTRGDAGTAGAPNPSFAYSEKLGMFCRRGGVFLSSDGLTWASAGRMSVGLIPFELPSSG